VYPPGLPPKAGGSSVRHEEALYTGRVSDA
jgi:hypothetical protein